MQRFENANFDFSSEKKNLSTNIQNTNFDNIDYNSNYSNYNEDTN